MFLKAFDCNIGLLQSKATVFARKLRVLTTPNVNVKPINICNIMFYFNINIYKAIENIPIIVIL